MEQANLFSGDPDKFGDVDIESCLAQSQGLDIGDYSRLYSVEAKKAAEAGDAQAGATYAFLRILTSFAASFDTPGEPFKPIAVYSNGTRTLAPSDLTPADIEALRKLAPHAKNVLLRARLYDLFWELTKEHAAMTEAAASYRLAAEALDAAGTWTDAESCYERGLQLYARLGRKKETFRGMAKSVEKAIDTAAADEKTRRCCGYLHLALDFQIGKPTKFAAIAEDLAEKAEKRGEPAVARDYWELAAGFNKAGKQSENEKKSRIRAAETYVAEAKKSRSGPGGSALAASKLLKSAVEALRRAGGDSSRIKELRDQLNQLQKESLKEMQVFSTKFDISKRVRQARQHVKEPELQDALVKFAFGYPLANPAKLKDEVREQAAKTPMTYLFNSSAIDAQGRTVVNRPGLFFMDEVDQAEADRILESHAFEHAARYEWVDRASAFIEPARQQVLEDHFPSLKELSFLVINNPFVPAGHEPIFLRGIHAGFNGDWVLVAHLLVPQIENSLRYVLESNGVDVSNLMSDRTQPVKVLGTILGMSETKKIFGEQNCFELRGLLIEKTGYDFRNLVAHGFVDEAGCYSYPAINTWWLVIRFCILPFYHMQGAKAGPKKPANKRARKTKPPQDNE